MKLDFKHCDQRFRFEFERSQQACPEGNAHKER
ncbi:hypothetical protein (plasmid) [Acinetobacter baumannii]|nr:hypothetical protein [Acinetobacter baumannii]QZX59765.1 hypothetical protein [Acinetobacter baumannii]